MRINRPSAIAGWATSIGKRAMPLPAQAVSTRMLKSLVQRTGSNATTLVIPPGPISIQLRPPFLPEGL
jgi:hypothetical protein